MAYDEYHADRIRNVFRSKKVDYIEKKMMGGLCFMVDDKMCCGTHINAKIGDSLLMARIGKAAQDIHFDLECCLPMDFTKRVMKGYVYVISEGIDLDEDLEKWIQLCFDFNPEAKSSKRKKRSS